MNEDLMMGLRMMRRVLLLTALCAATPGRAETSIPGTAPPLEAALTRASAVLSRARLPGELVVADADGAERAVAYGLADREARKANRVGQRWVWASITKQVTATLVMQEVDRGRIALDAAIGTFLPGFGGDRAITIRQLLQHRSGLPNPADTPAVDGVPAFYRETGSGIGNTARAAGFCAGAKKRPRGGDWEYNNCDYLVLGAVLEAVTGLPYGRLVDQRIARPLGLRSLRLAPDSATRGGAAAVGYDGAARVAAVNVATGGASHALTGSARDLAEFDRALMAGRLLSPQARATAWEGDPQLGFMALGVWSFPARLDGCAAPVQIVERRGDFAGTQVRNIIAPELGRAVILFTNDQSVEFGEVWQGEGLTFDLLSAALCPANP